MAIQRLTIDGKAQVELNRCAFQKDGSIEAQCAWDETSDAENGMLLAVNKVTGKVTFATAGNTLPVLLNYTSEKLYESNKKGLKNFSSKKGDMLRLGWLEAGDLFTTNAVSYEATTYTNDGEFLAAVAGVASTALFGNPHTDGSIVCSATAVTDGLNLVVVKKTTLPDGSDAVQFQKI